MGGLRASEKERKTQRGEKKVTSPLRGRNADQGEEEGRSEVEKFPGVATGRIVEGEGSGQTRSKKDSAKGYELYGGAYLASGAGKGHLRGKKNALAA